MNQNNESAPKDPHTGYSIGNLGQHSSAEMGMSHPENFVIEMLDHKKNGYYVELGAYHSQIVSNTYQLETKYDWKGVSFEIVQSFHEEISANRKNPCILGDATQFNYTKYFEENNFPKQIDFLQVDIDGGYNNLGRPAKNPGLSLLGLIALPLNTYRFSVITFEHDARTYYKLKSQRDASREILDSLGYSLVVKQGHEDWWVDPNVINYPKFMKHIME
jgi:hypothetical protein